MDSFCSFDIGVAGGINDPTTTTFLTDFSLPHDPFLSDTPTWSLFNSGDLAPLEPATRKLSLALDGDAEVSAIFDDLRASTGVVGMDIFDDGTPDAWDIAAAEYNRKEAVAPAAASVEVIDVEDSDIDAEGSDYDGSDFEYESVSTVMDADSVATSRGHSVAFDDASDKDFFLSETSTVFVPEPSVRRSPIHAFGLSVKENIDPIPAPDFARDEHPKARGVVRSRKTINSARNAAADPFYHPTSAPRKPTKPRKRPESDSNSPNSFTCAVIPQSSVDRAIASGVPLPSEAHAHPAHFHYLWHLGCRMASDAVGMLCPLGACARLPGGGFATRNIPDMTRHILTHFRAEVETRCDACPLTFSREDARRRHLLAHPKCGQASAKWKSAVREFNALPAVQRLREEVAEEKARKVQRGPALLELNEMFQGYMSGFGKRSH